MESIARVIEGMAKGELWDAVVTALFGGERKEMRNGYLRDSERKVKGKLQRDWKRRRKDKILRLSKDR